MLFRLDAAARASRSTVRLHGRRSRGGARCQSGKANTFGEGDIVILRRRDDQDATPFLSKPLKPDQQIHTHRGAFEHNDIIGKRPRDVIFSSNGRDARLHAPTLGEYVELTPRIVTPVYPGDANLIVSLLDLHLTQAAASEAEVSILEAGTGHGSLTLHLSRAIHAANIPKPPPSAMFQSKGVMPGRNTESKSKPESSCCHDADELLEAWKRNRQAVIHTIDISAKHSAHAQKIVAGFRKGLYAGNVDFHVGDVSEFIDSQLSDRRTPEAFLSHVVLDMPAAHKHLDAVAKALRVDGALLIFNPSITQITQAAKVVKDENLPLWLEQTIELGAGFTAGRPWDVRYVKPRASRKIQDQCNGVEAAQPDSETAASSVGEESHGQHGELLPEERSGWEMVCRPKVGERLTGGGFLGMWKKTQNYKSQESNCS